MHYKLETQFGARQPMAECPNKRHSFDDVLTRRAVLRPCGCNNCLYCNRQEAKRVRRAVSLAAPDRMLLATHLTGHWPIDRVTMKHLRENVRRAGFQIEMCWAVEHDPGDDRAHVHGWVWGDSVPAKTLRDCASRAGLGDTTLRRADSRLGYAYIVKNATHNLTSLAGHREANGTQLVHATRGFWRDAVSGEVVGFEAAQCRARSRPGARPAPPYPKPIRLLPALRPADAALIRDRNGSRRALISTATGEIFATRSHLPPNAHGSGLIGPLFVCFRSLGGELNLIHHHSIEPVIEQTVTVTPRSSRKPS